MTNIGSFTPRRALIDWSSISGFDAPSVLLRNHPTYHSMRLAFARFPDPSTGTRPSIGYLGYLDSISIARPGFLMDRFCLQFVDFLLGIESFG